MASEEKFFEAYEELQKLRDNNQLTRENLEELESQARENKPSGAQGWSEPFDQARDWLDTEDANDFFSVGS